MKELDLQALNNADKWLCSDNISKEIKDEILRLKAEDTEEFNDAFYKKLAFGTGGLRGIMGVGTNRMNSIVVAMSTQGFANYILQENKGKAEIKVVIAFDSRNNSKDFAQITARVFAGNGFKVYLFENIHPTPLLSFAVRELKCDAGVMLTASHNPKEYNGYKAYWNDGGQLVFPHDENVIAKVNEISDISQVKMQQDMNGITILGDEFDEIYFDKIKTLSLADEDLEQYKDIKIAYTPLHGTGYRIVPQSLHLFGFNDVVCQKEQSIPDGNFPTTKSPNPEERTALELGIKLMEEQDSDILLATDPDADREALTIRDNNGKVMLLNGNQTATLLTYYLLERYGELKKFTGKDFIIKTIVSSELIKVLAEDYNVKCYDVLTGFKWIADKILALEGKENYIGGGEESYGYLIGDFVRDKDSVSTCCIIAEMCAWAKQQGKTIYDILMEIYRKYGYYQEGLVSIVRKGKTGAEEIEKMMTDFRNNPPQSIIGHKVVMIKDYELKIAYDITNNSKTKLELPKSNVLQYFLEDGSKISVRPSGTEPKIKFYFGVKTQFAENDDFVSLNQKSEEKIEQIKKELKLV
ncbi:MAG: phospho-sugar mutase [Bacteroidales bacterium]|nr:phospho-sugar mutase [Bacteroidales bacterium]